MHVDYFENVNCTAHSVVQETDIYMVNSSRPITTNMTMLHSMAVMAEVPDPVNNKNKAPIGWIYLTKHLTGQVPCLLSYFSLKGDHSNESY